MGLNQWHFKIKKQEHSHRKLESTQTLMKRQAGCQPGMLLRAMGTPTSSYEHAQWGLYNVAQHLPGFLVESQS